MEHMTRPYDTMAASEARIGRTAEAAADDDAALASVPNLARRLLDNATTLIRKELALATAEVKESVDGVRAGVGGVATGGAVLYAGFLFMLLAAVLGLMTVMVPWAAALAVGAGVALVGLIMLQVAKRKLRARRLVPARTVDSVSKDADMIRREAT